MTCCYCESTNIEPLTGPHSENCFHCKDCGRSWVRTPPHPPMFPTYDEEKDRLVPDVDPKAKLENASPPPRYYYGEASLWLDGKRVVLIKNVRFDVP